MLEHPTETLLEAPALVEWLARHGHGEWDAETLRQWIRHPVTPCPVARPGKPGRAHLYRPLDVVAWLSSREAQAQIHADPKMETDRQRARLLRLQADEREGLLVPAEQVEAAMGRVIDATRTAALALPHVLTDRLGLTDQQRDVVHAEVLAVLERLAQGTPDDDDDDTEEGAAP